MFFELFLCLLIADFFSGVFHWLEDTYAVPGPDVWINNEIVYPNILHHRFPKKIVEGDYWSHIRVSSQLVLVGMLVLYLGGVSIWQPYVTLLFLSHANLTHALAHTSEEDVSCLVLALQRSGIFLSNAHHAEHHRPPYSIRYCTMTNFVNPILDAFDFWRKLEALLPFEVKRASQERGGY